MLKKDYWTQKGFSESYADVIIKGVRVFAKETGLREEDIEGLKILISLRDSLRPSESLKDFLSNLLNTLIQRQGILLTQSAKKGFLRFYREEEIEEKVNQLGEGLLHCLETDFDPVEYAILEIIAKSFVKDTSFVVQIDRKLYSEFLALTDKESAERLGILAKERIENLIRSLVKEIKDRKRREKVRGK